MDTLSNILQLPQNCIVHKKITKAFFKRNFDLTTTEKSLLDDFNTITAIDWLASIGPANANINRYRDEQYTFEEVQVITVQTGDDDFDSNYVRIVDLVQKYIPYPILLCVYNSQAFVLNTCDKKINQNDNTRRTIEKKYFTETISRTLQTAQQQAFLQSLSFAEIDKTNLKAFYDGYNQCIIALQAADISGSFVLRTADRTHLDMDRLEEIELLQKEITALQNHAQKETQLRLQINMNTQIQFKRKQIEKLKSLIIS